MTIKAILLGISCTTLFNLPMCCCFRTPHAQEPQEHQESCGHCSKKKGHSHSVPHSKECGCPHVSQDASADFGGITIVPPSGPECWEPSLPPDLACPKGGPEVLLFLDRGPPPDRVDIPVYLLILHLII